MRVRLCVCVCAYHVPSALPMSYAQYPLSFSFGCFFVGLRGFGGVQKKGREGVEWIVGRVFGTPAHLSSRVFL